MTPVSLRNGTPVSLRTGTPVSLRSRAEPCVCNRNDLRDRTGPLTLLLAALTLGCTPGPAVRPSAPYIVLNPPSAPAAGPSRLPPGAPPVAAVVRDTAALRGQATRYVVRRDANPAVIDRLTTLTLQSRRAIERLQAMRTRHGYRPEDVIAARVAADTLAAFLQTQSKVAPPNPPPSDPSTSEAHP